MERLINALRGRKKSKNKKRHDKKSIDKESAVTGKLEDSAKPGACKETRSAANTSTKEDRTQETRSNKRDYDKGELRKGVLKDSISNKLGINRQRSTDRKASPASQTEDTITALIRESLPLKIRQLSLEKPHGPSPEPSDLSKEPCRSSRTEPLVQQPFKANDDTIQFADDTEEYNTGNGNNDEIPSRKVTSEQKVAADISRKQFEKAVRILGPGEPTVNEENKRSRFLRRQSTTFFSEVKSKPKEVKIYTDNFKESVHNLRCSGKSAKPEAISKRSGLGSGKLVTQDSFRKRNGLGPSKIMKQDSINRRSASKIEDRTV